MGKPNEKLKKILLVLGATGAVYGCFRFLLPLVLPFLFAWCAALLLAPSARYLAARSRIRVRGKVRGIPVGIIGMAEFAAAAALLGAGLYYGCCKLCVEAGMLAEVLPVWVAKLDVRLTAMCHRLEEGLCLTPNCLVVLVREMLQGLLESTKRAAMPYLVANSVAVFGWGVRAAVVSVLTFVSVGLAIQEMDVWRGWLERSLFRRELAMVRRRLRTVADAYVKTQGVIMLLTTAVCTAGFWLLGNSYYLLAGIGIGILDALPVFGTGTVLVPWAVCCFFGRQWGRGLALLALYLICYFLREWLEAKMMGGRVGLTPLGTLMAMYAGLRLFGVWGFLLGPIGVLLVRDFVEGEDI